MSGSSGRFLWFPLFGQRLPWIFRVHRLVKNKSQTPILLLQLQPVLSELKLLPQERKLLKISLQRRKIKHPKLYKIYKQSFSLLKIKFKLLQANPPNLLIIPKQRVGSLFGGKSVSSPESYGCLFGFLSVCSGQS